VLVRWTDSEGRNWTGRLYHKVGKSGVRAPLVIQLKPFSRTDFSLLGADAYTSSFVAQILANRGIAVLQMESPDGGFGSALGTPVEPEIVLAGIEAAISTLEKRGLVNTSRVGLSGFSRSGWYVEYAISLGKSDFAAALAVDNVDASYGQGILWAWPSEYDSSHGGQAFGAGLSCWLESAPAFNADRIRTPLRLQGHSSIADVLKHWEMYTRLRYLGRPVELYFVPELNRSAHNLQNPAQQFSSRQAAVDWFDFWLNDRENIRSGNSDQYIRWRGLRTQRDEALRQDRAPRLDWQSRPVLAHASPKNDGFCAKK
jgi:hypothetical protein